MKLRIRLNGREEILDVTREGDRLRLSHEGRTQVARLIAVEDDQVLLEIEGEHGAPGRRLRAAGTALEGQRRQLWLPGRLVSYERLPERPVAGESTEADAAGGGLAPDIPAVVSEVLVAPGDAVASGQKLILLESMKMVIPIVAPTAGVVRAIHCAAGDAVQPGIPLVDLGPPSP